MQISYREMETDFQSVIRIVKLTWDGRFEVKECDRYSKRNRSRVDKSVTYTFIGMEGVRLFDREKVRGVHGFRIEHFVDFYD